MFNSATDAPNLIPVSILSEITRLFPRLEPTFLPFPLTFHSLQPYPCRANPIGKMRVEPRLLIDRTKLANVSVFAHKAQVLPNIIIEPRACMAGFCNSACYHEFMKAVLRISIKDYR